MMCSVHTGMRMCCCVHTGSCVVQYRQSCHIMYTVADIVHSTQGVLCAQQRDIVQCMSRVVPCSGVLTGVSCCIH